MEQSHPSPSGGRLLKGFIVAALLFLSVFSLSAQNQLAPEPDFLDQEHRKDSLKEMALDEIAEGEYRNALDHLNAALALSPSDTELQDLKKSIEDLLILDEEHGDLAGTDDPHAADTEEPDFSEFIKPEEDEVLSPDFASELLSEAQRQDPTVKRNTFSMDIAYAYGLTETLYLTETSVSDEGNDEPDNPFYRLSAEAQAFVGQNMRNLGIAVRYKDIPYNENDVDTLKSIFDVCIHYRGFFAETMESRLILGAKIGVGALGIKEDTDQDDEADGGITYPTHFIGGFYFSDALMRYLFTESVFFNRLIIGMDFDFFFVSSLDDVSFSQYTISGGYQFTDHIALSIFSEVMNTSSDIENTSSWEAGGLLKLTF